MRRLFSCDLPWALWAAESQGMLARQRSESGRNVGGGKEKGLIRQPAVD